LLAVVSVCAWHWRHGARDLAAREWAAKWTQGSAKTQETQPTSYQVAPISTSGSEVAGTMPNAQALTETPVPESNSQQPAPGSAQSQPKENAASPGNSAPPPPPEPPLQTNSGKPQPPASAAVLEPATASVNKNDHSSQTSSPAPTQSPDLGGESQAHTAAPDNTVSALEAEGERYLYGTGVPANCVLAQRNLLAAAEHDSSKAESVLGTMYATGHCTPRDLPLAYIWFAKAMQQEPNNAILEREELAVWNEMTAEERQLAIHQK
jgi:TPR repeat protein